MQTHKENIAKIQQKMAKKSKPGARVAVRDVVACQVNDFAVKKEAGKYIVPDPFEPKMLPKGEFDPNVVCRDGKEMDAKFATNESEEKLIERMAAYINQITEPVVAKHLKENFAKADTYLPFDEFKNLYAHPQKYLSLQQYMTLIATPEYQTIKKTLDEKPLDHQAQMQMNHLIAKSLSQPEMKSDKTNSVTRFFLNEFALYPYRKKGPLTEAGLNKLLLKIAEIAAHYPENTQLMLGSVPVKAKTKPEYLTEDEYVLENIVIAVNCGKPPKFHLSAKAFSSDYDPQYTGVLNINAINIPGFEINRLISMIIETLRNDDQRQTLKQSQITFLIKYIEKSYPDRLQKKEFSSLIAMLNGIADNIGKEVYLPEFSGKRQAEDDATRLFNKWDSVSEAFEIASGELPIPYPELILAGSAGLNIDFGGDIQFTTAGGVVCRMGVDVCLDHDSAKVKQQIEREIDLARARGDRTLPVYASHVLISNSFELDPAKVMASEVIQSDPFSSIQSKSVIAVSEAGELKSLKPETAVEFEQPIFGPHTRVEFFPERVMMQHIPVLAEKTGKSNQFSQSLRAMQVYREQRLDPLHIDSANRIINLHILGDVLQSLQRSSVDRTFFREYQLTLLHAANQTNFDKSMQILSELKNTLTEMESKEKKDANTDVLRKDIDTALDLLKFEKIKNIEIRKNVPEKKTEILVEGDSDLQRMIINNDFEGLKHILKSGKQSSDEKVLALQLAAMQGDMGMMLLLIEHGANFLVENNESMNSLEIFVEHGGDLGVLFGFCKTKPDFFAVEYDPPKSLLQHMLLVAMIKRNSDMEKCVLEMVKQDLTQAYSQIITLEHEMHLEALQNEGEPELYCLETQRWLCQFLLKNQSALGVTTDMVGKMFVDSVQKKLSDRIKTLDRAINKLSKSINGATRGV